MARLLGGIPAELAILPLWSRRYGLCSPAILAVWTTLPFLVFGAGGLTVDTPSPDALCPPLEQTRSIVESRLGAVELEGTWRATYVLVHRAEGDWLTLRLRDPSGAVRLEREFAAEGGSCSTLAQVIALVLERYFLRPEMNVDPPAAGQVHPDDSGVSSLPVAGASPPASTERLMPATTVRLAPAAATAFETRPAKASKSAFDAGLWISTAWVAPSLGVAYRATGLWSLGLSVGYDLSDHESPISIGWGSSRRIPMAIQGRRQLLQLGSLRLDFGAELLGLHEHVQTRGLFENGTASRFVPGMGSRFGAELVPGKAGIGPFVELFSGILLRWLSTPFEVDRQPEFILPTFVVGLHFGIRTIL